MLHNLASNFCVSINSWLGQSFSCTVQKFILEQLEIGVSTLCSQDPFLEFYYRIFHKIQVKSPQLLEGI